MSFSPAQVILPVASAENAAGPPRSAPASVPPAAGSTAKPSANSPVSEPAVSSPEFSTDLRIDSQHQIFYAFVDASTGDVVFEIPPEALREIGESLNLPLEGEVGGHNIDMKS